MLYYIKLVFLYCLLPTPSSGSDNGRLLFANKFLLWQSQILSIDVDRCLCVSFGFINDLGTSMIELNLDVTVESWNKDTIGSIDDCFLVFVGGSYIDKLDQVAEKLESIGKKLQSMARAIFINSQKGERRNIKETWPPLVSVTVSTFDNYFFSCKKFTDLLPSFQSWAQVFVQYPVSRRIHQQCF